MTRVQSSSVVRSLRFTACWCAILVFAICLQGPANAAPPAGDQRAIQHAIDSLDLAEAERLTAALGPSPEQQRAARYFRGVIAFHHGDYLSATQDIDAALSDASGNERNATWSLMQTMAHEAQALVGSMAMHQSPNQRYRVYVTPQDALLVPYALLVLEAADRALTEQLGIQVPGPVRLEIFPNAASLARVSPLTEQQIETSGTIALCKWNRLMITTPRALVRGYPWADTIAHELTHLFVSIKTKEQAPVWLQEGIAKMSERNWRSQAHGMFVFEAADAQLKLDAASDAMLLKAAKDKTLLPFERLHPSIAMLPSQEQAQLAFAQVSTFMQRFVTRHGAGGLRDALQALAHGEDARTALGNVAKTAFANLEREWGLALAQRPAPTHHARPMARRLRNGKDSDELSEVDETAARRFVRLGDMLWSRSRNKAAAAEYKKALDIAPHDPIVTSRYGRSALQGGDNAAARDAMQTLLNDYPEHEPALAVLASARLALGDRTGAQRAAIDAVLINPFDPQPHCTLAQVLTTDREREQQLCTSLR